jgi:hypothetical protein
MNSIGLMVGLDWRLVMRAYENIVAVRYKFAACNLLAVYAIASAPQWNTARSTRRDLALSPRMRQLALNLGLSRSLSRVIDSWPPRITI